ncbi:MAG: hypothetical protein WCX88_02085 [Patescibacteria group bacterium]
MTNDPKEILRVAKDALEKAIETKKQNQELIRNLGPAIIDALKPILKEIADNSKIPKEEVLKALSNISIPPIKIPSPEVSVTIPEIKLPNFSDMIKPVINYTPPKINIPDIKMPEEMNIKGWVNFMGYDRSLLLNPLPVQLRDAKGNPISLFENLTQIMQSGGGGKMDFLTIKGFQSSAYSEMMNSDGRLRVSVETGGSGLTDSELRASSVPIEQVSGSIWSTYVSGMASSSFAEIMNPDGRVKVELPSGSSGLTDTELRASHLDVQQLSGSIDSVYVTGFSSSISATLLNGDGVSLDPRDRNWNINQTTDSIKVDQVSGVIFSVYVTGSQNSTAASLIDSSGAQYSGSNPIPITIVSGALNSIVSVGDDLHDAVDTGGAPLKIGGIAMSSNPSKVAGGDRVSFRSDLLGRQLTRPVQVRDLIKTAYASVSTGTETTILAGVAGSYLDLIKIMMSNNSTVAVGVDIRAVIGGNIIQHYEIPANGVVGESLSVPWPQDATGNAWTIDMPDITGTTVYVSALFSQEI